MKKPNYVFDDELYHWGILGQKWGTRRFQNEDGSLTAEGRERYGVGDKERIKIEKAKATYNTQKYKADLKSKAQMEKDVRSAKEERNRIKENSKTMLLARKKQSKFDLLNKKENTKLENQGRSKIGLGRTKDMSDEDLAKAINRLKLQAEYNKQYTLATQPNSMLVKADRFFEGPTGKLVSELAIRTIPDLTKSIVTKALETKKEDSELDIEKKKAEIRKTNANAQFFEAQAAERMASLNKGDNDSKYKDLIQLPPAYPNAPRSSDIPKTQAIPISTIGKTVRPDSYNIPKTVRPDSYNIPKTSAPIGKTVSPGYSIIPKTSSPIGKTVAPGYSIIPKTTAPEKKKKKS